MLSTISGECAGTPSATYTGHRPGIFKASSHEARAGGEHILGGNTDGMDVMAATDPSTPDNKGPLLNELPPPPVEW